MKWKRRASGRWLGKRALVAAVATASLAAVTLLRAVDPWFVGEMRERTFDLYQRLEPRPFGQFPVRIVDIDEASLAALGQWPWPRTRIAALVDRLRDLGAAAVAFDILFAEPDRSSPSNIANDIQASTGEFPIGNGNDDANRLLDLLRRMPDHDRVLAAAIARVPAVTAFATLPQRNDARPPLKAGWAAGGVEPAMVLPPFAGAAVDIAVIDEAARGVGAVGVSGRDQTGIVRRVPMLFSDGIKVYPSLALDAVRVARGESTIVTRGTGASGVLDTGPPALLALRIGDLQVPLTRTGELWVYYDHDRPQRYVSARDLLDPAKEAEVRPLIAGQIVFIGASAAGLNDSHTTALGEYVPGVSIHAQIAEQILAQTFLVRPDWADGAEIAAMLSLGALLAWLLLVVGARFALATGILVIAAGGIVSWVAFSTFRLLLDPIYPSLGASVVGFATIGTLYFVTDKERKFVRGAFRQYLAPELLAKLERAPELLRLGGEVRPLTIMFMDVRDFTVIAEALSAQELVQFVNKLLSPLTEAIQEEQGTVDKYVGDAIMAFWNAPLDVPDHAERACRAALRMRAIIESSNAADAFGFRARGMARPDVNIRIGINTGEACVGNMGAEKRFNYSVLGDAVNVAARIEAAAKGFGVDIVVSAETAELAKGFALLPVGEIALKGKSHATRLCVLAGGPELAASGSFAELASAHRRMMTAIEAGDVATTRATIDTCRGLARGDVSRLATLYDALALS